MTREQILHNLQIQSSQLSIKFKVDAVYWLTRSETSSFQIKFAFPLGFRYPPMMNNLNMKELNDSTLIKFLHDNHQLSSDNDKMSEVYLEISSEIQNSMISLLSEHKPLEKSENSIISFEMKDSSDNYYALFSTGSFLAGTTCHDLDICIVRSKSLQQTLSDYSDNLSLALRQNSKNFHIVRNINSALVPIIELCLKTKDATYPLNFPINSTDIQIHEIPISDLCSQSQNYFYDNFEFMFNHLKSNSDADYNKIFPLSGIFENQNMKKYVSNFKDFQMLIAFVKFWANARQIYGKAFGFMGGISWSILVAYFLQRDQREKIHHKLDTSSSRFGALVKRFFEFSAKKKLSEPISLVNVKFVADLCKSFHKKRPVMIFQTVFPYHNTTNNMSETGKQVVNLEFERAWDIIKQSEQIKAEYQIYETLCKKLDHSEFKLKLCFKISFNNKNDLSHIFTVLKAKILGMITTLERNVHNVEFRAFTDLLDNKTASNSCFYFIAARHSRSSELTEKQKQIISEAATVVISSVKSISLASDFSIVFEIL